jgi:hypothetical protein
MDVPIALDRDLARDGLLGLVAGHFCVSTSWSGIA